MDNSTIIIIFLSLMLILSLVNNVFKKTEPKSITQYPYKKKFLLTKTEYAFYNILKLKCNSNNLIICPKVRLEDFISVYGTKEILKYRGYIKSRHIDFLICDDKLQIKAAIELDDNSHSKDSVKQTDEFKNKLFEKIGIPLFRIKTIKPNYESEIDNFIAEIKMLKSNSN